ncbi:hypothetical protein AYO21_05379 [Fonsecaea monophora]|uniref:Nephrocystin 3-like N-terminal domain-containing protein n=1 Tax=Fonsecaea monophora TaxID=254056 RepID=A0A177FB62_9EURO|nr:hypothetical protein AYO21_05379 [Fonsecaea monophora]OAG40479.1 hypothetical protein AYO21_05379 [Fonsecaea monophora]
MAALRFESDGPTIGDHVDDPPLSEAADGADGSDREHSSMHDNSAPQSPLGSDTSRLSEGHLHEGLKLSYSSAGHLASEGEEVNIDVVHVLGVDSEEKRLTMNTLLASSVECERREFIFKADVASLLVGDFATESIESQSLQLLRGLTCFQRHDKQLTRRAMVFVAYDLGALIVKNAISIAGQFQSRWPGIFSRTARFVFSGCFQRSEEVQALKLKLFKFLRDRKDDAWAHLLTPTSIESLATATRITTELFVASRISMRTRIFSLYANETGRGTIHSVFEYFTATLGLPREYPVLEGKDEAERFPALDCSPLPQWQPLEQSLLSLALPHRQMQSKSLQPSHSVLMSSEHKEWRTSSGPRILYIHGKNHRATSEAAEQVYLSWQAAQRDKKLYGSRIFSFSFSSQDPTRDSTVDFLSSLILQNCAGYVAGPLDADFQIIQDQFQLHHRWTEKDLLNLFLVQDIYYSGADALFLLQDIDQCEGWEKFLTMLNGIAATTEDSLALVVTSGPSRPLHDKIKAWPDIPVHQYTLPASIEDWNAASDEGYLDTLISSLCPSGHGEARIRKSLQKLMDMSKDTLIKSLELIKDHTTWPKAASVQTLSKFCSLIELVTPSSTPAMVLDQILRSNHDQGRFRWILKWLLCGYRPLTRRELAVLLCHYQRTEEWTFVTPSSTDLQDAIRQLDIWLCGFVDFSHDQVCIRDDIWDLLEPGMAHLWDEVRSTASGTILNFILAYLSMPEVQEHLNSKYSQYESLVHASGDEITPPLCPDGQDIVFYAVQAFPCHLSENPLVLKKLENDLISCQGPMALWMKVYWAMSNPFSRPCLETLSSASETLLASENLRPSAVKILRKFKRTWPDKTDGKKDSGPIRKLSEISALVEATRAGNQDLALVRASQIVSAAKTQQTIQGDQDHPGDMSDIPWPSSVLWMATWLNMDLLVDLLLENGMNPDPDDNASRFFPSPLYMAARMGYAKITRALLSYGAKVDVLRAETYNSIYTAAGNGHIDVIEALLEKDDSLLELQKPNPPLYIASIRGNWKVVETLCALKADPDSGIGPGSGDRWAPLIAAAAFGQVKTIEVLLIHKADVNISGPSGDTPLWFAAVRAASLESVRVLLDKKADPNHELIDPPLLVEMMQSGVPVEDRLAIFDLLIDNDPPVQLDKADPDSGMTPLMHAARAGETAVVKWLLEHGADVNFTNDAGIGALYYGIEIRHVEVLRELLEWKPELDRLTSSGETLLQIAADDASIVKMLLQAGANAELTNSSKQTIINIAVGDGKADLVRLLASRKVDIHHRDQFGWPPLLDAIGYFPDAEIVRILVESGANLEDTLNDGRTPLHLAATSSPEILKILLEFHGALDLEKCDEDGETPLLGVTSDSQMENVKLLVRAGANINAQDPRGWTPLMKAVNGSMPSGAVDFLLSQPGIKVNIQGKVGTALHIACRRLSLSDITKLMSHGADPNHYVLELKSTPLIASCFPSGSVRSEHLRLMERVVRKLVEHPEHPADVKAMHGTTVYNAICAAALAGGPGVIDYLLTVGASTKDKDPLGRVPIHFAAANGIRNFEFVKLAHREDLMISDRFGKNVLHWAAQFGHVETVEDIFKSFATARERKEYTNRPDVDGWTALCWACRPFTGRFMTSEERDYAGTVLCLLKNGADRAVECRMGQGDSAETFTPLKLAKLCNADDEIIGLLTHGLEGNPSSDAKKVTIDPETQGKKYTACAISCDTVFGQAFQCQSCDNFNVCKKCYGRIDEYHSQIRKEDGRPHDFKFREGHEQEFQDPSAPSSPRSASTNEPERGREGSRGRRTPEAMSLEEGDILDDLASVESDELDFSDFNDPYEDDDLP